MIDQKLYRETFSRLHASEETVSEVLKMANNRNGKTKRWNRRAVTVLLAAALAVALSATAFAVASHTDFFQSVFGDENVESYEAYEEVADDTKPDSGMITVPAYERETVDEQTAETLVGAQVSDQTGTVTVAGTTLTVEELLVDDTGAGILTFKASNPDGFPAFEKVAEYAGAEISNYMPFDGEQGWIGMPQLKAGNSPIDEHTFVDKTRSNHTELYLMMYFSSLVPITPGDELSLVTTVYAYTGETESFTDWETGEEIEDPAIEDQEYTIPLTVSEIASSASFTESDGGRAAVSPLSLNVMGINTLDNVASITLEYAGGTDYTIVGEDVRNIQFSVQWSQDNLDMYNASNEHHPGMGEAEERQVWLFNRLVDPESVSAVHVVLRDGSEYTLVP